MKKVLALMMVCLLIASMVVGCGSSAPADSKSSEKATSNSESGKTTESISEQTSSETKKIRIGMSMSEDTQFLTNVRKAAEKKAKELGIELITNSGQGQVEKQINDMEAFISMGVDAIIFNPLDRDAMDEIVDKVKAANIPLVEVNTFTSNDNYDVYVGSPEEDAGRIQGEWIAKNLGESGGVAIMYGVMGHSGQIGRYEGLKAALLDKYPGWKVIVEKTGNWKREEGQAMMEDWLQAYKDKIDVIASQNDEMAMGAIAALEEAGMLDQIKVLGIDASPDAVKLVKEGKMAITVFQDSFGQGAKSVEVAYDLAMGKPAPSKKIDIPFQEVNASNADDFEKYLTEWE